MALHRVRGLLLFLSLTLRSWLKCRHSQRCPLRPRMSLLLSLLQGKTYTKVNVPKDNRTWMIENAIAQYAAPVEGTDIHVQTFRTATGVALESWSSDGGYNWTFPVNSTLPNPNSRVRPS